MGSREREGTAGDRRPAGCPTLFDGYGPAKRLRLMRLFKRAGGNLFVLPLDHSLTTGPVLDAGSLDALMADAARCGVDAVVLHKGRVRWIDVRWFSRLSLIIHVSASTTHAPDPTAKVLVASVEEAVRLAADAVSVHINLGSAQESRQLADAATVGEAGERWGLPVMAMIYPPGPDPMPEAIAHAASVAVDLGCDVVKTAWSGSVATMAQIIASCPIPILAAGGPRLPNSHMLLDRVAAVMTSGARGVAIGRNIFEADCPATVMRQVAALVHRQPPTAGRCASNEAAISSDPMHPKQAVTHAATTRDIPPNAALLA